MKDKKSTVRAMCGVQVKDRKTSKDLIVMLGLNKPLISWLWQTVLIGTLMCRGEKEVMS